MTDSSRLHHTVTARAGDFPPSLRSGVAGARNDKWMLPYLFSLAPEAALAAASSFWARATSLAALSGVAS
jgi:hypothetical protein